MSRVLIGPGITTSVNSRSIFVPLAENGERAFRVLRALHAIAKILQHVGDGGAHAFIVFHHQNGFAAAFDRADRRSESFCSCAFFERGR